MTSATVAVPLDAAASPVDWELAGRVARRLAGNDPYGNSYLADSLHDEFAAVTAEAEGLVEDFTGLSAPTPPRATVLDRAAWVDANIVSMQRMLGPLLARVGERTARSWFRPAGRSVTGMELGALLGWFSRRVLGQYDLLVPDDGAGGTSDAVYLVGPNVVGLEKRFGFRPREFRLWIALHEVTHRVQFTGVPWMRGYFLSLVEDSFAIVEPDPGRVVRALAAAADEVRRGRNPLDEGGIVALLASPEQRATLARVQALMSVLEGHGNRVMNELGARHVAGQADMDAALRARRQAGGLTGFLHKALGIESKLRQYEVGEAFVTAVERAAGPRALDPVWRGPEWLPTTTELDDPDAWLARVGVTAPEPVAGAIVGAARALADARARLVGIDDLVPPVVVGCSGGPDSMALLALAVAVGLDPVALYVDHGLRAEGPAEGEHVRREAERLGARAEVEAVHVGSGPNLEARARAERYACLEPARARLGATVVLIGHTADDQAETVILNLMRGSGSAGLGAMPVRRGDIVRPMLTLRRADTEAVCHELAIPTVHDPMNDDDAYRRVFVRRHVLPTLAEGAGRDIVPVLARQASILRAESEFLDELARAAWPVGGTAAAVALAALHPVVARRAVRTWLGSPPPSADEVERVLAVARGDARATELSGGRRVARRSGQLSILVA